ncbi:MAG: glycosyltransferase [Patescibacteria group bacterium]
MKNKIPKIIFWVDGNRRIGTGHLMRCLALAHELKRRINCQTSFLMKNSRIVSREVLKHGYAIENKFPRNFADIIITSFPSVDQAYLKEIKKYVKLLVVIDDSPKTQYPADIVVKCSCVPQLSRHDLKSKSEFLVGLDYVIIDKEFKKASLKEKKIHPEMKSILITMGGSDVNNFTPKIMEALGGLTDIKKIVIIGPAFEDIDKLKLGKDFNLKYGVSNMAELMFSADLAIVGGGITLYELACVGTPGIVLCQTDYQFLEAKCFEKKGAIINLGLGRDTTKEAIASAVKSLISNKEIRKKMSLAAKKIIDGRGAERVVDKILSKFKNHE